MSPARSPSGKFHFMSTSLNRMDTVRRRQLLRLRKRSDWFLGPAGSVDAESAIGGSQDVLSVTVGGGGAGETNASLDSLDEFPSASGAETPDSTLNTTAATTTPLSGRRSEHRPLQRLCAGLTLTAAPSPPCAADAEAAAEADDSQGLMSTSEVRYFMVENEYGSDAATSHADDDDRPTPHATAAGS